MITYNDGMRASQLPLPALCAMCALVGVSGCRELLGIGDSGDDNAHEDGGVGADAQATTDGAVTSRTDGAGAQDGATVDAGREAGSVNVDARFTAWKPAPDTPTQLSTTNGGAVVVDAVTGLWWEQTNAHGVGTLGAAAAYCASINTGGQQDWRVPTRVELISIVDFAAPLELPAIFDSPKSEQWTQSRLIGDGTQVYFVDFVSNATFSLVGNISPASSAGYVRCVRNGRPLPASPTSPLPPGLWVQQGIYVHNTLTDQSWEKTPSTVPADYDGAAQHCASLVGAAYRIPTIRELDSLTDESRIANPAWPAAFDGTQAEYWSQTPVDGSTNFTWKSSGLYGVSATNKTNIYVRCVSP